MNQLTDESPMPWGKYKGTKMANVPANYLIWLWNSDSLSSGIVKNYIQENLDSLKQEVKGK